MTWQCFENKFDFFFKKNVYFPVISELEKCFLSQLCFRSPWKESCRSSFYIFFSLMQNSLMQNSSTVVEPTALECAQWPLTLDPALMPCARNYQGYQITCAPPACIFFSYCFPQTTSTWWKIRLWFAFAGRGELILIYHSKFFLGCKVPSYANILLS